MRFVCLHGMGTNSKVRNTLAPPKPSPSAPVCSLGAGITHDRSLNRKQVR